MIPPSDSKGGNQLPSSQSSYATQELLEKAVKLSESKQFSEALRLFDSIPDHQMTRLMQCRKISSLFYHDPENTFKLLLEMDEAPGDVVKDIQRVLNENHEQIDLWIALGMILHGRGEKNRAREAFKKAERIDEKNVIARFLCVCYLPEYREEGKKGVEKIDFVLSLDPNFIVALQNKSVMLREVKDWEGSLECLEKVLQLRPKSAIHWRLKARDLKEMKRIREAIEVFDYLLKWDNNNMRSFDGRERDNLVTKLEEEMREKKGEALRLFRKSRKVKDRFVCSHVIRFFW